MSPTVEFAERSAAERIPVAISGAHVYLTPATIEALFCDRYKLHEHGRGHQPTQYSARESVTLIGPLGRLLNVPVIGPPRARDQVEISRADGLKLGIAPPLRESGDLDGTPGVMIEGPRACVKLGCGVIRSLRHLHMNPEDASRFGLRDHDRAAVASAGSERRVLLSDVIVHVSPDYRLELHLNPDEGEAASLHSGDYVVLSGRDPLNASPPASSPNPCSD